MPKTKFITNEKLPLGFGYSIRYNHQPGGPDFSRVNNGQVMLLSNHNSDIDKVLGTVSSAHHDNSASSAQIDLLDLEDDPAIKRAGALLKNEMKGISAGILVHEAHVDGKTLEVDKWELVELSLTPIPRDAGTSIDMGFIVNEGGKDGLIERFFKNSVNDPPTPPVDPSSDPTPNNTEVEMPTLEEIGNLLATNNQSLVEGIGTKVAEAVATLKNDESPVEPPVADPPVDPPVEPPADEDVNRMEGHPVGCKCTDCEVSRNEAAKPPPDHPAVIQNMVNIATTQSRFKKEEVLELHRLAIQENQTKDEFAEKLETIAIHPSPFMPNSSDDPSEQYNMGRALTDMMRGRSVGTPEQAMSDEILNKTNLPVYNPNTLAIPWHIIEQNTKYGGTAGTDSAGSAVQEELLPMIRTDIPDPLNVLQDYTRLPSTPGDSYVVYIDVPRPEMVAEPGDTGYLKTGDAHTNKVPIQPKLQVDRLLITRLAGVAVPTLLTAILNIGLQMMTEQMNRQSIVGLGTGNEITGLYNDALITKQSSEIESLSGITASVITNGLDASFQFAPGVKRIIVAPEVRTNLRTIARPAAVGTFFAGDGVDGTPVLATNYFQQNQDGTRLKVNNAAGNLNSNALVDGGEYRGLIFPPADVYFKQWDDAVFVHTRYEDGNQIMVLESFWNQLPTHRELYYKILDNTKG